MVETTATRSGTVAVAMALPPSLVPLLIPFRQSGASEAEITAAEILLGQRLPEDYREVLRFSNGMEGMISPRAYVSLWSVADLPELNAGYSVSEFIPGMVLFGTDGGGVGYGVTTSHPGPKYVRVDLVGMGSDPPMTLGNSFEEFLNSLARGVDTGSQ